jgi:hypothetical protein
MSESEHKPPPSPPLYKRRKIKMPNGSDNIIYLFIYLFICYCSVSLDYVLINFLLFDDEDDKVPFIISQPIPHPIK